MEWIIGLVIVFAFLAQLRLDYDKYNGVVIPDDKGQEPRDFTYCILDEMID